MAMTDPIADYLTRVRNALMAGHTRVSIPSSKMKREISRILQAEGYIVGFEHEENAHQGVLHVDLKYGIDGEQVISGLERVSRPGRRVYIGSKEIPEVLGGMGISILSTSHGVLDGRSARQQKVGGELLCNVW